MIDRKTRLLRPVTEVPQFRGPGHYLLWLTWSQAGRVLAGALWGTLWMAGLVLPPYAIARAVDEGLRAGDPGAVARWVVVLLGVGSLNAALGLLRHRTMTFVRMFATFQTMYLVIRHTTRVGAALARRVSAGEVATISGTDVVRISQALTIAGPGVGAVVAYAAVTALLLSVSPLLAVVVVVGVPLLALLVGPLLNRLQRVEKAYRAGLSDLTRRTGDAVVGLRVLSGLGARQLFARRYEAASASVRDEGYRVGATTSWIEALAVGLPGIFLAVVVWLAAHLAAAGQITIGEMIAVHGYLATLVVPVQFLISSADELTAGLVSARRVVALLAVPPTVEDEQVGEPGPAEPAALCDPRSGLVVPAGVLLGLAVADPGDARAILDRLGGYAPGGTTWGAGRLDAVARDEVRARILVADDDAYLFSGTVQDVVTGGRPAHARAVRAALRVAAAEDVIDSLPEGLDTSLAAQALTVSGGQRQRLRLARAVFADAETLLLDEPVSALDAHTEAIVAHRLRVARAGRTTVVATTSALLLDRADLVAYVANGTVVAVGTHASLLVSEPGYRGLVLRGEDGADATRHDGDCDVRTAEMGGLAG